MEHALRAKQVALAVILLLFFGRLAWLPVAVFIVSGSSMLPTYKALDIVLGVATYATSYGPGDVVAWYATLTHGVIHRVESVSGGYVVTKGDNNPIPDPPVPQSLVKYKAVFRVPREAWLPPFTALAAYAAYKNRRRLVQLLGIEEPERARIAAGVLAFFIAADLAALAVVPVQWLSYRQVLQQPSVELRSLSVEGYSRANLVYSVRGAELLGVQSCSVSVGGEFFECASATASGAEVTVELPGELYSRAYELSESAIARVILALNLTFDKGWVYGEYSYTFNWKRLEVEVSGREVIVRNPNPVPFNLTGVRAVCLALDSWGRPQVVSEQELGSFVVAPLSEVAIAPQAAGSYCYVQFSYAFKFSEGGYVYESRRVDLG